MPELHRTHVRYSYGDDRDAPPQLGDGVRSHRCNCECSQNIGEGENGDAASNTATSSTRMSSRTTSINGLRDHYTSASTATSSVNDAGDSIPYLDPWTDQTTTTLDSDSSNDVSAADQPVIVTVTYRLPNRFCKCKVCSCRNCNLPRYTVNIAPISENPASPDLAGNPHNSAPSSTNLVVSSGSNSNRSSPNSSGNNSLASSALLSGVGGGFEQGYATAMQLPPSLDHDVDAGAAILEEFVLVVQVPMLQAQVKEGEEWRTFVEMTAGEGKKIVGETEDDSGIREERAGKGAGEEIEKMEGESDEESKDDAEE